MSPIIGRVPHLGAVGERSDGTRNYAPAAVLCNNMPLLTYIGGKPGAFTSKDHNFLPGQTVEKQLIVINNSRETVTCDCHWSLRLPNALTGSKAITLPTGQQERIPLSSSCRRACAGPVRPDAAVRFSNGETQKDTFAVHVLPAPEPVRTKQRIMVFDPNGETCAS